MAGKHAGWRSNTWPDMDGRFMPETAFRSAGAAFEDGDTIHWIHRTLAWVVLAYAVVLWRALRRQTPGPARAVVVLVFLQFALGVATVMTNIPVALGVAHQVGAFFLLTAAASVAWARRPGACNVRPFSPSMVTT